MKKRKNGKLSIRIVQAVVLLSVCTTLAGLDLRGTDIYNGLRGAEFNAGWKFNRGDVSGAQAVSFNDSSWQTLDVPHDWSISLSFNSGSAAGSGGGYLDGGIGWYRKSFTLPQDQSGKRVFVGFDGVYMNSEVWVNGTSLGTRPYGYVSFEYDITQYVSFGSASNVIAVRVNNNQPNSRWYSGSGIFRNVWLTLLDPVRVAYCGAFVTTPSVSGGSATVSVSTKVRNDSGASKSVTLSTSIADPSGATVATNASQATNVSSASEATVSQSLTVSGPKLWNPWPLGAQNLYVATVRVLVNGTVTDTYRTTFGIRTFAFDANNGFSCNGAAMKLNGVCMHHDLGSLGAAVNYRAIERQMEIMKSMGVNAIRTSHNPPDPALLEVCDRLGLVVLDEAFDCWESTKTSNDYGRYFTSWAHADVNAFVARDRNHPSVIAWSIGNEIGGATATTAQNLRNWVREMDATRPVTWGSNSMSNTTYQTIANGLDLVGYNYGAGMYDSHHSAHPAWKMFGSETSSAVRSRGIYKTPTTQNILSGSDTQCSSYDNSVVSWGTSAEQSYRDTNSRSFIAGEFIWTGFDYIGEPTPYSYPAKSSYFGIVDTCGFQKDIYYFYQSRWTTTPMVHILPHWNWSSGQTVEVWAYTNCDSVELLVNGRSLGSKSLSGNALHLAWSVAFESGTLRAQAVKNGSVVATHEIRTAGSASRIQLIPDRTSISADGKDLVFVETNVLDANNVFVPTATNAISFSVSGPGKIVGVDNGNAISLESYKGTTRSAFSGKCLVIVQSTGASGQITVSASSNGLSSASASVQASGGAVTPEPTAAPTPTPAVNRGDANGNGTVDIVDALLIAQYYVGLNPSGFVASNADANCSGTIDIVDALLVAQYYVGLIASFPC